MSSTEAPWTAEPLSYEDLTDAELRALIELPEDTAGLRYYMSKGMKVEYLSTEDEAVHQRLLDRARERQVDHHAYLRRRRRDGSPDRRALIERKMGGRAWRFITQARFNDSFADFVTGRKAKIAYIVEDTMSGDRVRLTRSTLLDAHERLGLITGWPPPKARTRAPEAKAAGLVAGSELTSRLGSLRDDE